MTQPKLITKPFADDALPGYVNEIPKENPTGAPEQNASWAVGFPPITMTDIDDGGLPPNGEDMNGVLRAITEHNLFIGGGGVYEFTDDYITEVGGYSKGAVLISDDKTALWMSIQDNNTQNFNGATKNQWRRIAFTELDSTLASIQDALNTKADKSVTITAGDGLTGGGTLEGDRVIAVNSSVVRTDRTITAGTGLSGGGNLSANRTLSVNYGTTAGTAAQGNDSRITGAAQKSANLSDLSSAAAARQNLGLGTAATRDVGVSSENVMEVGAFGIGQQGMFKTTSTGVSGFINPTDEAAGRYIQVTENGYGWRLGLDAVNTVTRLTLIGISAGTLQPVRNVLTNLDLLTTTGQSTEYPMTQKAVTDALNTKVGLTGNQTISGLKTFSQFPVTPSAAPTANYQVANKKYVDDALYLQPGITGSITLNGTTDNTVVMTDIVTELALEIGDVIRIDTGAYNKLHTVESITDNSSIIVNYEHAGNRANGSLKLPDFTGEATVTRIAKWFNAPLGLGQAWVSVAGLRAVGTSYENTTGRSILVALTLPAGNAYVTVSSVTVCWSSAVASNTVNALMPNSSTIYANTYQPGSWAELR